MPRRLICLVSFTLASLLFAGSAYAFRPRSLNIDLTVTGAAEVSYDGWCTVDIGNRSIDKVFLKGEKSQPQPMSLYGRSFDSCLVEKTSNSGILTLTLRENGRVIFEKSTTADSNRILFGPEMRRYSIKPHQLQNK